MDSELSSRHLRAALFYLSSYLFCPFSLFFFLGLKTSLFFPFLGTFTFCFIFCRFFLFPLSSRRCMELFHEFVWQCTRSHIRPLLITNRALIRKNSITIEGENSPFDPLSDIPEAWRSAADLLSTLECQFHFQLRCFELLEDREGSRTRFLLTSFGNISYKCVSALKS